MRRLSYRVRCSRSFWQNYGAEQILVVDPTGRIIRSLPAGKVSVSNLAFGGEDMKELYITGSAGDFDEPGIVYRLELGDIRGPVILRCRPDTEHNLENDKLGCYGTAPSITTTVSISFSLFF